jgi:DNA-directed RNA polymerase subunit beta'
MKNNSSAVHTLDDIYDELEKDEVTVDTIYSYSSPKKTNNKVVNMKIGRIWFNLLLPEDYRLINEPVNKSKISEILNDITSHYDLENAIKTVNLLNEHSFKMSSINPVSFNINDLIVPEDIKNKKKETLTENTKPEEFGERLNSLSKEFLNSLNDDSGIKQIINSGAKGKPADIGVLMLAKGSVIDIEDNVSKPILTAQIDGYSGEEVYTLAGESRRALYIRGIGTASPGELARDVTYANANTKISKEDCGVKRYLELKVDKNIFNRIQGRYYMSDDTNQLTMITQDDDIIGKTIKLRSPLYCRDKKGICNICYGDLSRKLNSKHIGFLAGQVINKTGLEGYSMSLRHQSIKTTIKEVDFTKDILRI